MPLASWTLAPVTQSLQAMQWWRWVMGAGMLVYLVVKLRNLLRVKSRQVDAWVKSAQLVLMCKPTSKPSAL